MEMRVVGGLLREPILICSGSAGHLRVRRLPGHCLPQNELLQVRGESNCFPQKGCTGWLDREDLYSMAEGNEEGGLVAQYGKVVGVVRDLLWR